MTRKLLSKALSFSTKTGNRRSPGDHARPDGDFAARGPARPVPRAQGYSAGSGQVRAWPGLGPSRGR